jgi:hypothetical protein
MTAPVALVAAIWTLSQAASNSFSLCRSAVYHLVEKPDHTLTKRDSLNE